MTWASSPETTVAKNHPDDDDDYHYQHYYGRHHRRRDGEKKKCSSSSWCRHDDDDDSSASESPREDEYRRNPQTCSFLLWWWCGGGGDTLLGAKESFFLFSFNALKQIKCKITKSKQTNSMYRYSSSRQWWGMTRENFFLELGDSLDNMNTDGSCSLAPCCWRCSAIVPHPLAKRRHPFFFFFNFQA